MGLLFGFLPIPILAATVRGTVQPIDSRAPAARRNKDYSGVVVWLERRDGTTPALQPKTARIVQKNKRFVPPVLAVPVGSTVTFPNFDPIFHNAFSNFSGQMFDVGLHPPGTAPAVRFQRAGFVRVFCNIHATMSAVIAVLATPYMTISNSDGAFALDHVASGEYRLHVFHERSTQESLNGLEVDLTVGEINITLPLMLVPESDSVRVPHKNKFGRDYPPSADDGAMYPAGRKR
ncbi:MAG: hypothetical protein HY820_29620 [Acidobacteria bacterium]|nr:hypothetical protein [Acidobacteriota bacterium]